MVLGKRWSRPIHYALILLVHAEMFVRARMAGDNDWVGSFHPLADVLRLIVLKYRQFPWWNPWALGGLPYFALPESAVFSLDTPLILAFGAVLGPKIAILCYTIIGYEGTRLLLRHLFLRPAQNIDRGCTALRKSSRLHRGSVSAIARHFCFSHRDVFCGTMCLF